ncbi:hypothetical protein NPIL_166971 [Nephila pilipes]|uniref:Uncharacterized protein n=1 Tax=Nephila pilipes TaxID=299642 RepID=A0A8X6T8D1_NEPPI|nr:hypothetical protein NPIL_166971 [Nephila pilipes]
MVFLEAFAVEKKATDLPLGRFSFSRYIISSIFLYHVERYNVFISVTYTFSVYRTNSLLHRFGNCFIIS